MFLVGESVDCDGGGRRPPWLNSLHRTCAHLIVYANPHSPHILHPRGKHRCWRTLPPSATCRGRTLACQALPWRSARGSAVGAASPNGGRKRHWTVMLDCNTYEYTFHCLIASLPHAVAFLRVRCVGRFLFFFGRLFALTC